MITKSESLLARCGIQVNDEYGNSIKFKAASWRAGFVSSGLEAKIPELQIRAAGRWSSQRGVLPYSVVTTQSLQRAVDAIVSTASFCPSRLVGRHCAESAFGDVPSGRPSLM